ncbi:hypothetical protein HK100_004322 [Physocladia obscura]|uniref:3-hydroxyisobutyryl-CoA hydrolase n=1 Tax=Physocladia obscura TaxID=109957 RepID=A0AAD5ST19_9FUNG|nr:hypothetical protein HK100_004322 [Physocladia obscura]
MPKPKTPETVRAAINVALVTPSRNANTNANTKGSAVAPTTTPSAASELRRDAAFVEAILEGTDKEDDDILAGLAPPPRKPTTATPTPRTTADDHLQLDQPQPDDTPGALCPVLFRQQDAVRVALLNRPAALNALSIDIVNLLAPQLHVWDCSAAVAVIVVSAVAKSRAFCAGGDVKAMLHAKSQKPAGLAAAMKFIESEYRLNHLIATLSKPYIAILNGIAMGGGIGISIHAPFRIATENTVFSMPETAIGLFPDVGSSFFLPRLDGELGTYLGLTCHRLKGLEVLMAGIATHYMPESRIPSLLEALTNIDTPAEIGEINRVIEKFSELPGDVAAWKSWSLGGEVERAINHCFSFDTMEEIIAALETNGSEWAHETLAELKAVSPTSLKVTLEQLRRGRTLDISSCFRMEYRMVQSFLQPPTDFFEGVTARLVEKRPAVFSPTFKDLSTISHNYITSRFFSPFSSTSTTSAQQPKQPKRAANSTLPSPHLDFVKPTTFFEYPHRTMSGFPTARDVERVISGTYRRGQHAMTLTRGADVVTTFLAKWGAVDPGLAGPDPGRLPKMVNIDFGRGVGKKGLKERVLSILEQREHQLK